MSNLSNLSQVAKHYNTGTDPQLSLATMELGHLKNLRESITRGGKILEAELEWLTEKLIGLEERLKESTTTIMVMEEEFRRMWADKYSDELIQKVDDKMDDADEQGGAGWSIWVEPATTDGSNTIRDVPEDRRVIAPLPRRAVDSGFQPIPHIQLSSYSVGHPGPTAGTTFVKPNVALPQGLEEFEKAIANF